MMMLRTSLGRRRATLFAIAVWLLVIGVAESDLVEGVTELGGSMLNQEQVLPHEASSTADLQMLSNKVARTPINRMLGSAGAGRRRKLSKGGRRRKLSKGGRRRKFSKGGRRR